MGQFIVPQIRFVVARSRTSEHKENNDLPNAQTHQPHGVKVTNALLMAAVSPLWGAKSPGHSLLLTTQGSEPLLMEKNGEEPMLRWLGWGIAACFKLRASLVVEDLCLRPQLLVLRGRQPRPRIRDADRRFWVLARRWFADWRRCLLVVKPETVLRWHRRGWQAYWRRRSRWGRKAGRRPIAPELRDLIRRMAAENRLWGQRRIRA